MQPHSELLADATEKRTSSFRPDIQGLRAIAIVAVVAFHCGVPGFGSGFVGVDMFFVLSGFLITGLLLREASERGRIDLLRFYARRMRRLLPASALMILCVAALSSVVLSAGELVLFARAARAATLYLANLFFALNSMDYFGTSVRDNPLVHMWSLAVEEQFYAVWPIIIVLCLQILRSKRALRITLLGVSAGSLVLGIWQSYHAPVFAFYGLPGRVWEFGLGAVLQFIPQNKIPRTNTLSWIGCGAVLISIAVGRPFHYPGWAALIPTIGTALLLLRGPDEHSALRDLLGSRPFEWVGNLSYSWYLWHWPVLVLAADVMPNISLGGRVFAATFALGIAWLTFHSVENPIRINARFAASPRVIIAASIVLMVGCVGAATLTQRYGIRLERDPKLARIASSALDIATMDRDRCVSQDADTAVKTCEYGDLSAKKRVVLAGDSHAIQWMDAMQALAQNEHWHLSTYLKSGCPIVDIPVRVRSLDNARACLAWRSAAVQKIVAERPSLVVIGTATMYMYPEDSQLQPVSVEEWRKGFTSTVSYLRTGGAAIALLRDTPTPPFDVPTCLGRAARADWLTTDCGFDSVPALHDAAFSAEASAVKQIKGASIIDMSQSFCDGNHCWPQRDGVITYRDDDHMTGAYAGTVVEALTDRLQPALR